MKSSGMITAFYLGQASDSAGRSIEDIWSFSDYLLESVHDYIQWLFPLQEPSRFNAAAPTLDDQTIQEFRHNPELRKRLLRSFKLMLGFYGFQLPQAGYKIQISKNQDYAVKKANWLNWGNHNYLRITRILTSLNLLGLPEHSRAFLDCLEQVYSEEREGIGESTIRYWRATARFAED